MPKKPISRHILKRYVAENMRKNGYSLQEIGDTIGLTRQRVCEILKKMPIDTKTKWEYNGSNNKVGPGLPKS